MKKFKFWQVGWEHEAAERELDDDAHCPACEIVRRLPVGCRPVVFGFQEVGSAEEHFHALSPAFGGYGLQCRKATPEEISAEKIYAEEIQSGKVTEATPEQMRASTRADSPPLLDLFEMFVSPASWAARKGAELGAKIAAKRAAQQKEEKCTCDPTDSNRSPECKYCESQRQKPL